MSVASLLPRTWKPAIKAALKRARVAVAQRFRSYDADELLRALRALGVRPGDTVMLHSAFSAEHGWRSSVRELIDVFVRAVGPQGHLMMVTLPYRDAALDWLERGRVFDVRRTPSMMGIVSEAFRRRPDVWRSLHPTHPVAVWGPEAEAIVATHPQCQIPCGAKSPFDALAHRDGKVVFLNVPIDTFTFFHYLEDCVAADLPFALYTPQPIDTRTVDAQGRERVVRTYAFSREAIARRRPERLYDALRAAGMVAQQRVGASRLLCVRVADAIACTDRMRREGTLFYD